MRSVDILRPRLVVGAVACAGLLAVACKKDPTAPVLVVAEDVTLGVNPNLAAAVSGTTFNFPDGAGAIAPALTGQSLALTMATAGSEVTTTMAFTSGTSTTGTVTATTTFGSCIFNIKASTFPAGHSLAVGQTVTVNPCSLSVRTTGAVANGQAVSRSVALLLGAAASAGATVTVAVTAGGQLTLNGFSAGTVQLVPVSGG